MLIDKFLARTLLYNRHMREIVTQNHLPLVETRMDEFIGTTATRVLTPLFDHV